jgi:hypothetical protein
MAHISRTRTKIFFKNIKLVLLPPVTTNLFISFHLLQLRLFFRFVRAVGIWTKLISNEFLKRCTVPPVLDVIFRSRRIEEFSADFNPSFTKLFMPFPELHVIFLAERHVIYVWIQMIDPAVSNLFSNSSWQLLR